MFLEKGTLVVRTGNGGINGSEIGHIFKTVRNSSHKDSAPYNSCASINKGNWRLATDREKAYFEAHPDTTNISEIPSDWNDDDIKVGDWVVSLEDRIGHRKKGDVFKVTSFTSKKDSIYYGTGVNGKLSSFRKALAHEIPNPNENPFDKIQVGGTFINTEGHYIKVVRKLSNIITVESNLDRTWDIKNSEFNKRVKEEIFIQINFNNKKQEDGKISTKNNDKEGLFTSNTGRQRQGNVIISVGRRQSTTGCRPVGNSQRIKCRESTVIKTKRSSNIISF